MRAEDVGAPLKCTDKQRAKALHRYELESPSAAEKNLGIPKKTNASWAKRAELQTGRNDRVAHATEVILVDNTLRRIQIRCARLAHGREHGQRHRPADR